MPDPSPSPAGPYGPHEEPQRRLAALALRTAAARRRREARIAGPRDRAELERLAERDERIAAQIVGAAGRRPAGAPEPRPAGQTDPN